MGILLFLVFALVIGWFLAAALSNQKPRSRREAIHHPSPDVTYEIRVGGDEDDDCDVLPPPLGNQYLEFNDLDVITTDEDGKRYRGLTPRDLKARAQYHANVVHPPRVELERNHKGSGNRWGLEIYLDAKSEEEWQLYVYSIKNYPDLLKIGIAKDAVKRKELLQEKASLTQDA